MLSSQERTKSEIIISLASSIIILYYTVKTMNPSSDNYAPGVKFWYKLHRSLFYLNKKIARLEKQAQDRYWELVIH